MYACTCLWILSNAQFCLRCSLTWPFFFVLKNIRLLCRVCLALPVRRERMETSARWWVQLFLWFSSVTAIHIVFTYKPARWEIALIVLKFWLAVEFGNSTSHLTNVSESCGKSIDANMFAELFMPSSHSECFNLLTFSNFSVLLD